MDHIKPGLFGQLGSELGDVLGDRLKATAAIPSDKGASTAVKQPATASNAGAAKELHSAPIAAPGAPSVKALEQPTTFREFVSLGYRRLVPIVPPDAQISANSSLAKRVGTPQDMRGKAVGVRGFDGNWFGFDWLPHEASEDDFDRWQRMGAGVGIKTGRLGDDGDSLVLIDADTLNEDHARVIRDAVEEMVGHLPARVGRYPKVGYPVRVAGAFRYSRVEFGERNDRNELTSRVEILSDGRQFVAAGIHPTTAQPYQWPRQLLAYDQLPIVEAAVLTGFLARLRTILPAATEIKVEGSTSEVNQEALRGKPDVVRKAVEATPNTSQHFGTRESYRDFGYAIKAALPDDEPLAFELFSDWCSRWQDGQNDPDIVAADWARMKSPFRRGAGWLYELAEDYAPGQFNKAEQWFETQTESESIFGATERETAPAVEISSSGPRKWKDEPPPKPRPFVIDNVIPDNDVSLLYGDGGVGKSLFAQQMATHIALGLPFLGRKVPKRKAFLFLCEDSDDELHRRQIDINRSLGLTMGDIADSLYIVSRKYMDNLLSIWDRNTGTMKQTAVWRALRDKVVSVGATFVVVDTVADTFGGSEIDRAQVRQFVQDCLGGLVKATGGAVLALAHPSQAGLNTGSGTSGSTGWNNTARGRLYLEHPNPKKRDDTRILSNKKNNYGPPGDEWKLRWHAGTFEQVEIKTGEKEEAETIAKIVDACMGADNERQLGHIVDEVGFQIREQDISRATARHLITGKVTAALSGSGVVVTKDGRFVRINAVQKSDAQKSPWLVRRTEIVSGENA